MRRLLLLGLVLGTACTDPETRPDFGPDPHDDERCSGEVERIEGQSLRFIGVVQTPGGAPVEGARVRLRDKAAAPPSDLGEAFTEADGAFDLFSDEVTAWPGCWAVIADYVLIASLGRELTERPITQKLAEAWLRNQDTVDITSEPILLSAPVE